MATVCQSCGELLCSLCGACHTGAVCLWSAPSCRPALALSGDEQRVYRALLRRQARLRRLVERAPRTALEARELHIRADMVLVAALDDVSELLSADLHAVIERLQALNEAVWNLPLVVPTTGATDA